jgi:hypothetical protein
LLICSARKKVLRTFFSIAQSFANSSKDSKELASFGWGEKVPEDASSFGKKGMESQLFGYDVF